MVPPVTRASDVALGVALGARSARPVVDGAGDAARTAKPGVVEGSGSGAGAGSSSGNGWVGCARHPQANAAASTRRVARTPRGYATVTAR